MRLGPTRALLLLLVALGLGLRVWGLGFGLPDTLHPDEPQYVLQALALARGQPSGVTFANPPLMKYVLTAEYLATYGLGRLTGRYTSPQQFIDRFRADPSLLFLEARAVSALAGAATVAAAYALARALRSARAGVLAAWLTAGAYLLIREAHFGVNDVGVTLLVTVCMVSCLRVAHHARNRDGVLAGVTLGLAFVAKYQALVLLVPLVLACGLNRLPPTRRVRLLVLALVAALLTVLLAFPWLWLEPGRVLGDMYEHLYVPSQVGYDGLEPGAGYAYYVRVLLLGLGPPLLIVSLLGTAWALLRARREPGLLVVASLPITLYLFLGREGIYFVRYLLPAGPPLLVLAAVAVEDGVEAVSRRRVGLKVPRGLLTAGLGGLLLLPSLVEAVRFDIVISRQDTRSVAREWLVSALPAGARVAVDAPPFGPPLPEGRFDLLVANGWWLHELSLDEYRARGVEYLVTSSFAQDMPLVDPARDAQRRTFNASLRDTLQVARFESGAPGFVYDRLYGPLDALDTLQRPGPTVTVYRLEGASAARVAR
jgi:4-amino-4-deoxy-L-arabinose transferase-like glycosyltransferase